MLILAHLDTGEETYSRSVITHSETAAGAGPDWLSLAAILKPDSSLRLNWHDTVCAKHMCSLYSQHNPHIYPLFSEKDHQQWLTELI